MTIETKISHKVFNFLSEEFDKKYEKCENNETLDSIPIYKTKVFMDNIGRISRYSDSVKLKLTEYRNYKSLKVTLHETKVFLVSFCGGALLTSMFFLYHQSFAAIILGLVCGTYLYVIIRRLVKKGLIIYIEKLIAQSK